MANTICLPRAVLAALVDPETAAYIGRDPRLDAAGWCNFCGARPEDGEQHEDSCPVRLAQEALART